MRNTLLDLQASIRESQAEITHDPLPVISANPGQVGLLFQNLIGNALKFRGPQPLCIHVGVQDKNGEQVFFVRDNGIGIDPQYFEKIFVLFQRLHSRGEYPGTGIGLSVVKKIVERHGGRVWLSSRPGEGATFYFTLASPPDRTDSAHQEPPLHPEWRAE